MSTIQVRKVQRLMFSKNLFTIYELDLWNWFENNEFSDIQHKSVLIIWKREKNTLF